MMYDGIRMESIPRQGTVRCVIGSLGIRRWGLQRPNLQRFKMLLGVNAEVLLLLPEMMRKGREIQRRRVVSAEYIESLMCR